MAQYIAVRALNRSAQIRLVDENGDKVKLTTTEDVVVNLDDHDNSRELARHSAFGQYIVTAANDDVQGDPLPVNS